MHLSTRRIVAAILMGAAFLLFAFATDWFGRGLPKQESLGAAVTKSDRKDRIDGGNARSPEVVRLDPAPELRVTVHDTEGRVFSGIRLLIARLTKNGWKGRCAPKTVGDDGRVVFESGSADVRPGDAIRIFAVGRDEVFELNADDLTKGEKSIVAERGETVILRLGPHAPSRVGIGGSISGANGHGAKPAFAFRSPSTKLAYEQLSLEHVKSNTCLTVSLGRPRGKASIGPFFGSTTHVVNVFEPGTQLPLKILVDGVPDPDLVMLVTPWERGLSRSRIPMWSRLTCGPRGYARMVVRPIWWSEQAGQRLVLMPLHAGYVIEEKVEVTLPDAGDPEKRVLKLHRRPLLVAGHVIDAASKKPVKDAYVRLKMWNAERNEWQWLGRDDQGTKLRTKTGADGRFWIYGSVAPDVTLQLTGNHHKYVLLHGQRIRPGSDGHIIEARLGFHFSGSIVLPTDTPRAAQLRVSGMFDGKERTTSILRVKLGNTFSFGPLLALPTQLSVQWTPPGTHHRVTLWKTDDPQQIRDGMVIDLTSAWTACELWVEDPMGRPVHNYKVELPTMGFTIRAPQTFLDVNSPPGKPPGRLKDAVKPLPLLLPVDTTAGSPFPLQDSIH